LASFDPIGLDIPYHEDEGIETGRRLQKHAHILEGRFHTCLRKYVEVGLRFPSTFESLRIAEIRNHGGNLNFAAGTNAQGLCEALS
jgi:hypothetical protein